MQPKHLAATGLVPGLASALSRRAVERSFTTSAAKGDTCESFASTTLTRTTSSTTAPGAPEPTEDPGSGPSPKLPGIVDNCDEFYKVSSGDTCDSITKAHGISTTQFKSWNTGIDDNCTNLWLDYYVCVHIPGATTSQPPKPTEPSGPTPQMPGIVNNCKSFHLIQSGDSCWSIYTNAGIIFEQFRAWNTQVDAACSNLWLGYYVCVGV
ncbi:LysM peptidoglycan-binding domain-containing protein [Aspergillus fischeri NRRL 181]|uniref:LysM domain protein n=1 Tax=Neosartorya fischeri (strain ATCC 1020 / DSM 3700 / CBS 544.65 / FGSC A1164 / JCM 1740 / NRRL 181 / WB 181) TaxID=331117 RepID=A1D0Z7_NEOFI|nr:LysM domain protein [Aspergillus fischeri NRRL 181]EAW22090.1 LysM domain protein [Aspergillus fischeri NRRL 181]KAG2001429.1 hypothetical protein GB937_010163 [Aspergillus fischeri]